MFNTWLLTSETTRLWTCLYTPKLKKSIGTFQQILHGFIPLYLYRYLTGRAELTSGDTALAWQCYEESCRSLALPRLKAEYTYQVQTQGELGDVVNSCGRVISLRVPHLTNFSILGNTHYINRPGQNCTTLEKGDIYILNFMIKTVNYDMDVQSNTVLDCFVQYKPEFEFK